MVVFVDDQLNRLKINHVSESEHVFILGPVSMVANNSIPILGDINNLSFEYVHVHVLLHGHSLLHESVTGISKKFNLKSNTMTYYALSSPIAEVQITGSLWNRSAMSAHLC
jgi:hypothetical protein